MMFVGLVAYTIFILIQNPDMSDELFNEFVDSAVGNGWLVIIGLALGMLFILRLRKKAIVSDLTKKDKSMTRNAFIKLFFCFMMAQPFFFVFSFLFESFLNTFGYTNLEAIDYSF